MKPCTVKTVYTGWTGIGWLAALIWAIVERDRMRREVKQ